MKRNLVNVDETYKKTRRTEEENRSVYLGNMPSDIDYQDVFNTLQHGAIESIQLDRKKGLVFIDFCDAKEAQEFCTLGQNTQLYVRGCPVYCGMQKPKPLNFAKRMAIQSGASRCVYIGNCDEYMTEEFFEKEMKEYGNIDCISVRSQKKLAFIHFSSIEEAANAIDDMSKKAEWLGKRLNFGNDRSSKAKKESNRTLYIGNIPSDLQISDLCNTLRGGMLYNIKQIEEKQCFFVTFVDPDAALAFYNLATYQGVVLKSRRLKVGWGKAMNLPAQAGISLLKGATRNIYLGSVTDDLTTDELHRDFSKFGEIEYVNILSDRNIAFVNFTNLQFAVDALDAMKEHPLYSRFSLSYGKDRCASMTPEEVMQPVIKMFTQYNQMYDPQTLQKIYSSQ